MVEYFTYDSSLTFEKRIFYIFILHNDSIPLGKSLI